MNVLYPDSLPLPRDAVLPDYGDGGVAGLARSVRGWLCDPLAQQVLPAMPDRSPGVLVLLVIDGLGDGFLARFGVGGHLLAHRRGRLASVLPSTTASAVTTFLTGLPPAAHGLTGWFIHDRRFGGVIAPLPLVCRGVGPISAPFLTRRLFPYASLGVGAKRPVAMLLPREIAFSPFSRRHARGARVLPFDGLEQLAAGIAGEAARMAASGGLIYAYYSRFDAVSHHYGSVSVQAQDEFWRIDRMAGSLFARLGNLPVDVLATADHGFIDAAEERHYRLARPEVLKMLAAPLAGERRLAFCAVKSAAAADFTAFAREELRGKAVLVPSARLADAGLFGPGRRHRRLLERIGTHALLMEEGWTVSDHVEGEAETLMRGVHGGMSAGEMWVPLIHAHGPR